MNIDTLVFEKIYHYYYAKSGPLKSITELSDNDLKNVLSSISETTSIHHSRLTMFNDYVPFRRATEKVMRKQFIEKGGRPEREYPHYFILGNSPDYSMDNPECKSLGLDPSLIDSDIMSFTFCDSMICYPFVPFFTDEGYNLNYEAKDFHGNIYHFDELQNVLKKYGHPNSKSNSDYPFPGFIEVQVWGELGSYL